MAKAGTFPKKPRELLTDLGLAGAWPIPLEELAGRLGFECFTFSGKDDPGLEGVSGFVDHDKRQIYINRDEPLVRQRFTLAHEIGHVVLHAGYAPVDYRHKMLAATEPRETEANAFASELLMDRKLFVERWVGLKCDQAAVAQHFGVSEDAAAIRVKTLRLNRA